MKRRSFLRLVAGTATMWPLVARSQQSTVPSIGFMSSRGLEDSRHLLAAFLQGLKTAGFIDGQNVAIEYRWANGQYDRLPAMAEELVSSHVSVLVTTGGEPSILAAKVWASSVPIVFTTGGDPVKQGLVDSISHPGGNMTGISLLTTTPETKRIGLLHELVPDVSIFGVLVDSNYAGADAQARVQEVLDAGRTIGRQVEIARAGDDQELETAFASLVDRKAAALLVSASPFFDTRRDRLIELAARFKLPAVYHLREYAASGGLMSYGISLADGYRQVGIYAAQILKGGRPADLPIYLSTKFEFVINLRTAKLLAIQVPARLLRPSLQSEDSSCQPGAVHTWP
jgi:putative ABC transport system substrate-binding protein